MGPTMMITLVSVLASWKRAVLQMTSHSMQMLLCGFAGGGPLGIFEMF